MTDMSFDDCTTIRQTNERYKTLFRELIHQPWAQDRTLRRDLQELHRKAMDRISNQDRVVKPVAAVSEDDPNRVRSRTLRQWAAMRGIPLRAKGRVPVEIENQYRAANGLELLPVEIPAPTLEELNVSARDVRLWASGANVECNARGRVHPDIIRLYAEAHTA